MEKNVVMVCAAVGFLGLLSAALGFAAEATRIKVSDVQTTTLGVCTYPRSPALALGLIAAVALMIAQAIINTLSGCICCKKYPNPSDTNWTIGLISFIASWVTFIIAFVLLLSGAALNDQWGQERMYFGEYCYVVRICTHGVHSKIKASHWASLKFHLRLRPPQYLYMKIPIFGSNFHEGPNRQLEFYQFSSEEEGILQHMVCSVPSICRGYYLKDHPTVNCVDVCKTLMQYTFLDL
ncbi:hypothetical protein OPV22_032351 [Ensete ventricosum]|uniref:Uncharacterized protein n=1 Tax=Ensete ventricosum TaxID=4639 RepID=A0AAV8PPE0_ENSVE|nr:hypothetical protein OPV22_032351 [Ensete ventricosum]